MHNARVRELILQSLEHERGGIQIYETALRCVVNADLRKQWEKDLQQTRWELIGKSAAQQRLRFR